ncbi:Pimeloyl-ACP methyl ester carboxylesterase [Allopseudospirillum japonicum]|uniref:Pimeloyl-ACP methyl ester carboxylesterase n=1 Tax=Allopseudospirillum japonicum TaxID=64971 RepID=A0A1H6RSP4_9GAMM|nr:alpha/beta fold hydrolase [Allopseudospirillum japonicum]SEI54565.1 Pimeloyl-ACP methyl ester carboxylesterase [Allopseudospirillum japonicum]
MNTLSAQEICLPLEHLTLNALAWGHAKNPPILALHGWLDNAATFSLIAPALAAQGYYVLAPDFAGHGYSDWRPTGTPYLIWEHVYEVLAIAQFCQWSHFDLLGHSMGAGIACLTAGSFPERIGQLALIEGIGTLATEAEQAPEALAESIHMRLSKSPVQQQAIYKEKELYIRARMQGLGAVSYQAAEILLTRGLQAHPQGYRWRTDPRLRQASSLRLSEAHNLAWLSKIQAPVCGIQAQQGFLVQRPKMLARWQYLQNLTLLTLEGGHHLHLEEDTAPAVRQALVDFWHPHQP